MIVQLALVLDPHHDVLIDVPRAVDELAHPVGGAVVDRDDLLTIMIVYLSPVVLSSISRRFEAAPAIAVEIGRVDGDVVFL